MKRYEKKSVANPIEQTCPSFRISTIQTGSFSRSSRLQFLDLSGNRLSRLTSADLSGATDLVEVTFRGNDLEYVPEDLLKHNGRLQRLDLSGNR